MENQGILKEFNREADEKLSSFSSLLKKDNKDFFSNLDNSDQNLNNEMEKMRKDIHMEAGER